MSFIWWFSLIFLWFRMCLLIQGQDINDNNNESGKNAYQPTRQEIERFQVIQEQIRQHQLEDRQQQQQQRQRHVNRRIPEILLVSGSEPEPRHRGIESLMIPHSAMVPMAVPPVYVQQPHDHRVPMPPFVPPPVPGQYVHQTAHPAVPIPAPGQPVPHPAVMNEMSHNNQRYLEERMRQMAGGGGGGVPSQIRKQQNEKDDPNTALMLTDADVDDGASRFDKKPFLHGHHHQHSNEISNDNNRYGHRYRCYSCHWNIAACSDFNCYNNPDICTTNHFARHLVQQADCSGGCEQFVITDPNGLIQQWKRGCAQPPSLPIERMRCHTYYEFGVRIDRCVCNHDWCNGSSKLLPSSSSSILGWRSWLFPSIIFSIHFLAPFFISILFHFIFHF